MIDKSFHMKDVDVILILELFCHPIDGVCSPICINDLGSFLVCVFVCISHAFILTRDALLHQQGVSNVSVV